MRTRHLARMTMPEARELFASGRAVALLPVGSVEPHGPHLPLGTDALIAEGSCVRAAELLEAEGLPSVIAPGVPYGVTDFAEGFPGAVSLPAPALTAFLVETTRALLRAGFAHVCLVNDHLEPAHDAAVRQAAAALPEGKASVACPLERRFARTLSAEFKSGACHAGRYETSLVLAARPEDVDADAMAGLPALPVSLSEGIRAGKSTFSAMGMADAYAGAPAEATAEEGRDLFDRLARTIVVAVTEALSRPA